jgi:hypothetical protein
VLPKMSADQKISYTVVEDAVQTQVVAVEDVTSASKTKAPGLAELWKHKRILAWCKFDLNFKGSTNRVS